jgi:hypothetical protein
MSGAILPHPLYVFMARFLVKHMPTEYKREENMRLENTFTPNWSNIFIFYFKRTGNIKTVLSRSYIRFVDVSNDSFWTHHLLLYDDDAIILDKNINNIKRKN